MKTVLLTDKPAEADLIVPRSVCLADSSIILPGRPLFIPDSAPAFTVAFCPVIRIDRLGKTIAPKFARRYFSQAAPLLRLLPQGEMQPDSALLLCGDSLAALGTFSDLPDPSSEITFHFDGTLFSAPFSLTFTPEQLRLEQTVACVSRFMTLKNGDLIAPFTVPLTQASQPGPDMKADITSNGTISRIRFK